MVFITSYISGQRKIFVVNSLSNGLKDLDGFVTCENIFDTLYNKEGICDGIFLACEGKPVQPNSIFSGDTNVIATLQLKGGKGGFGSMLRAIGAQIEKTTNREACRDLSGRRLRDINEEKRLKDFLSKKVEKEKEKLENKRKKLQQLKEGPKHIFEDKAYFEQREKREKDIYESLDKAFAGKDSQDKIFKSSLPEKSRKIKGRMLDDLDESSDEDSSDDDDNPKKDENRNAEEPSPSTSSSSASPSPSSENEKEPSPSTSSPPASPSPPSENVDRKEEKPSSTSSSPASPSPPSETVDKNGEKRDVELDDESEHIDKKLKTDQ